MRNLLLYTVVLLAAIVSATAIVLGGSPTAHVSITTDEMSQVLGGSPCTSCINFCGGGGCPDSRCDSSGDSGELCGSDGGIGTVWGCGSWGGSEDDCVPTGGDASCTGRTCHCLYKDRCSADETQGSHSGKAECSD